ncbi:hypothetical protein KP509_13G027600 [Ceratopteris richardii]|uniref:Aldehyde dehydrogenase n=1 Tax=Ceratopteris richardii TaxID=49495 RepID=A0A8T2TEK8_CERRI|nr:hypothetical protein KP509_13G027600 [Ceratopteris richardii]
MATLTEGLPLSLEDRFEGALKTARSTFQTGRTRALQWSIAQLNALKSMLDEHERAFCSALYPDLGKSHFEARYIELDNVRNSCDFFIKNLKKLVKPKSAEVPWYMKRSTRAKVVAEPLGVCAKSMCLILKQLLPEYLDTQAVQVLEATRQECAVLLRYKFDKIFWTDSPRIGRIIMEAAAKHLTPVTLELGGKSPAIIDSTADISTAARRLAATKWLLNCGQTCIAPDYILVHSDVTSSFLEALKEALASFVSPLLLQNPNNDVEPEPDAQVMPRIFNQESLDRLQTLLDEVKDSIVFRLGETDKENLVMAPTILLDPPVESKIMQEEIFGPILQVLQVHSMEEALNFFSLQSIPFGGVGESGMGSYHGRYGFDTFSHLKGVVTTEASRDDPIGYPPYTAKNKAILRACLRNRNMLDVILIKLGLKTF